MTTNKIDTYQINTAPLTANRIITLDGSKNIVSTISSTSPTFTTVTGTSSISSAAITGSTSVSSPKHLSALFVDHATTNRYSISAPTDFDSDVLFTMSGTYRMAIIKVLCSFVSYIGDNFIYNESVWKVRKTTGSPTITLLANYFTSIAGGMTFTGLIASGDDIKYRVSSSITSQSLLLNIKYTWCVQSSY